MKFIVIALVALVSLAAPSQAKAQSAGEIIRQVAWSSGVQPLNCLGWNTLWTIQCGVNTLRERERMRQIRQQEEEFFNRHTRPAPAPVQVPAPVQAPIMQRSAPVAAVPASINSRLAALHAECDRGIVQACRTVGR